MKICIEWDTGELDKGDIISVSLELFPERLRGEAASGSLTEGPGVYICLVQRVWCGSVLSVACGAQHLSEDALSPSPTPRRIGMMASCNCQLGTTCNHLLMRDLRRDWLHWVLLLGIVLFKFTKVVKSQDALILLFLLILSFFLALDTTQLHLPLWKKCPPLPSCGLLLFKKITHFTPF